MESKRELLRNILERIVNEGARNQMLTEEIIHLRAEIQSLKATILEQGKKIDTLAKQPFYYADMTPLPRDRFPIEEDNLPKKREQIKEPAEENLFTQAEKNPTKVRLTKTGRRGFTKISYAGTDTISVFKAVKDLLKAGYELTDKPYAYFNQIMNTYRMTKFHSKNPNTRISNYRVHIRDYEKIKNVLAKK